jgi:hypothetical protein
VHVLIQTASPPSGNQSPSTAPLFCESSAAGPIVYRRFHPACACSLPAATPCIARIALVAAHPAPSGFDNKALNVQHGLTQQRRTSPPSSGPSHVSPYIWYGAPEAESSHRGRNTPAQSRFVSDRVRIHDGHLAPAGSQDQHQI